MASQQVRRALRRRAELSTPWCAQGVSGELRGESCSLEPPQTRLGQPLLELLRRGAVGSLPPPPTQVQLRAGGCIDSGTPPGPNSSNCF